MNSNIFREYDIRGVFPDELNRDMVRTLGLAMGTYYHGNGVDKVCLGRDCRLSSPELSEGLMAGMMESGIAVLDVGMVPTPLLYFSLHHFGADGGVQITGSHNPPEFNGFKICLDKTTIYGDEIQKIREIIESGDFR